MKKTFGQQIEYIFSPQFLPDFIEALVSNKFFGVILFLLILGIPIFILLLPKYWQLFFESPRYFFISFICFFVPYIIIACNKFLRNPFFILPFTCSFFISSQTSVYFDFLHYYLIVIGISIWLLSGSRTPPPYIYTDFILEATTFFTWYGEARLFWKIVLKLSIPLFLIICLVLYFY